MQRSRRGLHLRLSKLLVAIQRGVRLSLLVAVALLVTKPAVGRQRSGIIVRRSRSVVARDEEGKVFQRSRYIWLAPGRVGVPARVYERLGFWVKRDARGRQVRLAKPATDVILTFRPDHHRLLGQSANVRFTSSRLPYPVARQRRGTLYVAAHVVQMEFADDVQTTWHRRTRILTIQRRGKFPPKQ